MFHSLCFVCGLLLAIGVKGLTLGSTAATYGVCAATTITNSGATIINGPIGLSPGTSVTGFPPGVASAININTPSANLCKSQAHTTYGVCVGLTPTKILSGTPLGAGQTLLPGIYKFATTASLSGVLTLDAAGNSNGQFIFQIGTTFTTAAGSKILLKNGAKACNVFFCVGSSAALGASTNFNGTIIAHTSISVDSGVKDVGGFFADLGAVTLIDDNVTPPGVC
ncbi:MAG: hypothetical protein M1824_000679 [Vezdaea acicularis]|nr:MAG: hypothetical protein M1824_000679 [Vezdaea acicularis]